MGATEVKVPELVDAIVDITETGSSLRANNLRIVDTLMESYPQFVASKAAAAHKWKRQKMDTLVLLLKAALEARHKVGLKMNVPEYLQKVIDCLPSQRSRIHPVSCRTRNGCRRDGDRRGRSAGDHPEAQVARRRGHRGIPTQQNRPLDESRNRRKQNHGIAQEAEKIEDQPAQASQAHAGEPPQEAFAEQGLVA